MVGSLDALARNGGVLASANAVGEAGSLGSGGMSRLMLEIDPASQRIADARFQAFGCAATMLAAAALTELVRGKSLDEARRISRGDIGAHLDGPPAARVRATKLSADALAAAIADWRGESRPQVDFGGEALLCFCNAVDVATVVAAIRSRDLRTVEALTQATGAGGTCCSCREPLEDVLAHTRAQMPPSRRHVVHDIRRRSGTATPAGVRRPITIQPIAAVSEGRSGRSESVVAAAVVEDMRAVFQADGGDVAFIALDGATLRVRLKGACSDCQAAPLTLSGLQRRVAQALGRPIRVIPVPAAARTRP